MRYHLRPLVAWTDPQTRRARILLGFSALLASAVMVMSPAAAQARLQGQFSSMPASRALSDQRRRAAASS